MSWRNRIRLTLLLGIVVVIGVLQVVRPVFDCPRSLSGRSHTCTAEQLFVEVEVGLEIWGRRQGTFTVFDANGAQLWRTYTDDKLDDLWLYRRERGVAVMAGERLRSLIHFDNAGQVTTMTVHPPQRRFGGERICHFAVQRNASVLWRHDDITVAPVFDDDGLRQAHLVTSNPELVHQDQTPFVFAKTGDVIAVGRRVPERRAWNAMAIEILVGNDWLTAQQVFIAPGASTTKAKALLDRLPSDTPKTPIKQLVEIPKIQPAHPDCVLPDGIRAPPQPSVFSPYVGKLMLGVGVVVNALSP